MPALKLSWESVPNAVSYTVFWALTPGVTPTSGIPISGITNVVFHHINLLENTTYYYIVCAVDGGGNLGPPSIEFSAKGSEVASLAITPSNANIGVGITQPYTALVTYSDGYTQDVTLSTGWDTDNHTVATIDASGLLTGNVVGTAHVQASYLAHNASVPITVSHTLLSIVVTPANVIINAGGTQQYTAIGHYNDLTTQDLTGTVTWMSTNTSAATIAAGGLATGTGGASTTISATLGLISGSTGLTVTPVLQQLTLNGVASNLSNPIGAADSTIAVLSTNGFPSSGVIQIDSEQIFYTGISGNTFTGCTRGYNSTTATSHSANASVAEIIGTISVVYPNTVQMSALGNFTDDSNQDVTNSVAWSSDTPSVATIDSAGLITTHLHGTAIITATIGTVYGPVTAHMNLVVTNVLASIAITPTAANLYFAGNTLQYTAIGTYNDGATADLTATATWHSSNTGVATINSSGIASAVATGSTNITATSGVITSNTAILTFHVWATQTTPGIGTDNMSYLAGFSDTSIMAAGSGGGGIPVIWYWNGTSPWTTALRGPGGWPGGATSNPCTGISVSPDGSTWYATNIRNVVKSSNNGSSWTACTDPVSGQFTSPPGVVNATTLWVFAGNNASSTFKLSTNSGSTWTTMSVSYANSTVNKFFVLNANSVYAVGNNGSIATVWHWNGTAWSITSTNWTTSSNAPQSNSFSIWGTSDSDMYLAGTTVFISTGTKSAIVHSTDMFATYTPQIFSGTPTISSVNGVFGTTSFTPSTIYAATQDGTGHFYAYAYQPGISTANTWINAGTVDPIAGANFDVWVNNTTGRAVAIGNLTVETNNTPV